MVMQRKKDYSMRVDESEALGYNTTLATLNLSVLESSRIQPNMGQFESKRKENLRRASRMTRSCNIVSCMVGVH